MESVHKQSMATSHSSSRQAVGWEQLHSPDADSAGASLRGQVASLGVFGGLFLFGGQGGNGMVFRSRVIAGVPSEVLVGKFISVGFEGHRETRSDP